MARSPSVTLTLAGLWRILLIFLFVPIALGALVSTAAAQEQPTVTQIDVVGAKKVEEATVRFKLKSRVGDAYSPEMIREDIKALYGLGYFEDIVVEADIFEGGLKLIFVLHEKPSIQSIRVVGNRKIATDKVLGKIDLVEGAIIPPGALLKNADKIRLYYEEESYFRARVDATEERISPTEVAVTFTVDEGNKYEVTDIKILGAKALKEKDIKKKMQTEEVFLWFFGGTLKREELNRDLDRIRAYYMDNGYLDIAVEEPQVQMDDRRDHITILIRVDEGPQYRIADLAIKGTTLLPEADIRKLIKSKAGGVFSRESVQTDVTAITDRYAELGYLFAAVDPVTDIRREQTTVDVSFEITEGRQAFINRIEIAGNVRTRDKVLRREIPLVEGDVFNSRYLQIGKKNLEALGFFEDMKLDTKRSTIPDKVDVLVDVKEKATGAFTIGAGFSSVDGVIGLASISQSNLFGLGKQVSLSGQLGQNANRIALQYNDPHFWDTNFSTNFKIYDTMTYYSSDVTYNSDTIGTSVGLGHILYERVFGTLAYVIERVKIKDVTVDAPFIILEQAQLNGGVSVTSEIIGTLVRDTRDSLTEATRGMRLSGSAALAGGPLKVSSDANNFYKLSAEYSQYWPIWWKLVGHLRASVLYGDSFSSTPVLPAQERFYLGGQGTVRGFKNFQLGPQDPATGGFTGGNKAWFGNAEMYFPIYEPAKLRGVVFYDVGNNLNEDSSFQKLFSSRLGHGAGVGLRFNSPLGNIALDWGFNLSPQSGERAQVLYFSAGTSY
jgi:outer membrane protein insertion porin family